MLRLTDISPCDVVKAIPEHAGNMLAVGKKKAVQIRMRRSEGDGLEWGVLGIKTRSARET